MKRDALINLRISKEDKQEFSELCDKLGIDMSVFLYICIRKALRVKGFPFEVSF